MAMKNIQYKQQGVVLVIGLLMLLVITMVGVTAMSGTTSNERMTANHQFQTLSFQAAESAIHDNFNIPAVSPSVVAHPAAIQPIGIGYDVNIAATSLNVTANANIQYCGEVNAAMTELCNGLATPCEIEQIFDVTGTGDVSALGMQETHQRRGARQMVRAGTVFNAAVCNVVQ